MGNEKNKVFVSNSFEKKENNHNFNNDNEKDQNGKEKFQSELKYPEKEWYFYTQKEKLRFIVTSVLKCFLFLILLYLFLLSLNFMSIGFTLVSRYALQAGNVIKFILSNPFAALSIGILLTALMQNATATTSIAVIMVGAGIIADVKSAVPIVNTKLFILKSTKLN